MPFAIPKLTLTCRRTRHGLLAGASIFLLAACGNSESASSQNVVAQKHCTPPAAGEDWPRAQPEEVGLDPDRLRAVVREAEIRQSGTFQIFRHGCLVADSRLDPLFGNIKRNMWSHTKTVVALITGRAVTLGHLKVSDTVGLYFPKADTAHAAITVEQLLTQSSGLNMNWLTEFNLATSDRARLALSLPVDHEPGTWFEYAQTPLTLLTAIVERAVGMDFQQFAQQELFDPIGIGRDEWFWLRDRAGNTEGWAWLFSEPNNAQALLGHLMLQQGVWHDRQLINHDYMRALRTPSPANPGYGYLTWLNAGERYITTGFNARIERDRRIVPSAPADMYTSAGFHGQTSTILPGLDMVVTRTHNLADLGGPDLTPDFYAIGADFGEGYYEILRKLMLAVNDYNYQDPGPWSEPADYAFDLGQFVNNVGVSWASLGLGPLAPGGCNLIGCDGGLSYQGTLQTIKDILTVVP
ncbi:MAG: serine hydrolase [Moraxellaceae bacterium]|nr:serine hydrolase [Moraxellaceae bacterium]MDZ4386303.1 serine hydrolase [Moraxellaceae bacterium]